MRTMESAISLPNVLNEYIEHVIFFTNYYTDTKVYMSFGL